VAVAWLLIGPHASAAVASADAAQAISPAMGQVLGELLDGGSPLADGSLVTGVAIERDRAVVTLRTPAGETPVLVLRAPGPRGGSDGLQRFTIDGPTGAARASLAARLAAGEARFQWTAVAVHPAGDPTPASAALHALGRSLDTHGGPEATARLDAVLGTLDAASADAQSAWTAARLLWAQRRAAAARPWLQRTIDATLALDPRQAATPNLGARLGAHDLLGQSSAADAAFAACAAAGRSPAACGARDRSEAAALQGQWKDAVRWFDLALGQGQPGLSDLLQRSTLAMMAGDAAGELRWAERAHTAHPDDPEAIDRYASACFRAGRFEAAVAAYERLYHRDPARVSVLAHLSGAFNRMHGAEAASDVQSAYARLRQTFERRARDPRDLVARFLQAVAVFYDADFARAIALFGPLQQALPAEPRVHIYLAMAHYWTGDLATARQHATLAVDKGPRDPDVYYCRSKVWQDERPQQAIADLERYVALAEAPGTISFADKTARIRQEMDHLRRGERPPDWDRPQFAGQSLGASLAGVALAVFAALAALWWWRRRRRP